jgi:superfamily II DNA or RNA helicase
LIALAGRRGEPDVAAAFATPLEVWACRPTTPLELLGPIYDLALSEGCSTVGELVTRGSFLQRLAERNDGRDLARDLAADLALWLEESRGLARPDPADGGLRAGMDAEELTRWAQARGVGPLLGEPARRMLAERLAGRAETWLWFEGAQGVPLGRVITSETARSRSWPSRHAAPRPAQDAAIERLVEEAARAAEGLRDEAARAAQPRTAPRTPALQALERRLIQARETIRDQLAPRPQAEIDGHLHLDPEAGTLTWIERGPRWCTTRPRQEVTLSLTELDPAPRCVCPSKTAGRCPVALAAVDAALDALVSPDRRVLARRIERVLSQQPVQMPVATVEEAPDLTDLGWLLRPDVTIGFRLEPVLFDDDGQVVRSLSPRLLRRHPERCPRAADRQAAERLLPNARSWLDPRTALLDRGIVHRAMAALQGHPRVALDTPAGPLPLEVRREELALRWTLRGDGGIDVVATLDAAALPPEQLGRLVGARAAAGLVLTIDTAAGACLLTPVAPGALHLLAMLGRQRLSGAGAGDALLARLPAFSRLLAVTLDPALRGEEVLADTRPVVRLEVQPGGTLRVQLRVRPLPEGQVLLPGLGPVEVYGTRDEGRVFAHRDLDDEHQRAVEAVPGLPGDLPDQGWEARIDDPNASLQIVEWLQQSDRSLVRTEWTGEVRHQVVGGASLSELRVSVRSIADWLGASKRGTAAQQRFAIEGEITVDGHRVGLNELFAAVRDGRTYVQTDQSAWLRLEQGLVDGLTHAAAGLYEKDGALTASPVQAAAFLGLERAGATLSADDGFLALLGSIRAAMELDPPIPAGFVGELRSYQYEGFRWMVRLAAWTRGGILADDMGLGKTIQGLALLLHRQPLGPALVIAPTSVGFNWQREAERFAPELDTVLYRGAERAGLLEGVGSGDVIVTSYQLLVRDQDTLGAISWGTVILDEAQAVKNPRTRRSLAAAALDSGFTVALTGTPMENRLGELWSVFRALNDGVLGTAEEFRTRFAVPIEKNRDAARGQALSSLIRPFVLRRLKAEVERELPPRTIVEVAIFLSPAERELYEGLRLAAVHELTSDTGPRSQRRLKALAALTRLRQAVCHPKLVDEASEVASSKLQRVRAIVAELRAEGHRALIFSQFVRHLKLVRAALEEDGATYRYLDGSTPEKARRREVDAFQDGDGDVFLISLRAGGVGLNLTAATYVIHLDPWWNPAVEDQATDRTHRIGQDRPVTVYRLVARGTIEDSIMALHDHKRALVAGVLEGTAEAAALGADDILELLGWEG